MKIVKIQAVLAVLPLAIVLMAPSRLGAIMLAVQIGCLGHAIAMEQARRRHGRELLNCAIENRDEALRWMHNYQSPN